MPAQRKYPEELRERAVKMVFEVRDREGKAGASWRGWRGSWVFTWRRCGRGSGMRKLTAVSGLGPRPKMGGGSRSWKGKCTSSAGPMR
jgi:hypothetical protein